MILLSHPGGHRNVRHVARALRRAGILREMWTLREGAGGAQLCQVEFDYARSVPGHLEHDGDGMGAVPPHLADALSNGASSSPAACDRVKVARSLDLAISRRLSEDVFTGIYAYQDAADRSFRTAGRRGLRQFYDLPFGHRRAAESLLAEEAAMEPEWAPTLLRRDDEDAMAREDSELHQASLVFVSSVFGLRTLDHAPPLPGVIAVIPYGAPQVPDHLVPPATERTRDGNLRVLFAGELDQRQGLSYLFRACRELQGTVSLTVMGALPPVRCPALERELRSIRWQPPGGPRQLLAEMAAHDVFVFPSLFDPADDGFLLAMAMGMPVIATPNTSAADLIQDGVDGFIVPVRSSRGIAEKLELLRREPDRRAGMGANARRRAGQRSWLDYERTLAASVVTALAVDRH